jgi:pSer/pThr/pTyr-binding forkhead associated (FHA) protein
LVRLSYGVEAAVTSLQKRAIVEVRWGPMASRRAVLEPGSALKVGRTERADFAVPHDEHMSGVHMEIAWDGSTCLLRDLKSASGTLLDGAPVTSAQVSNGSWIRAGSTDFSLYIEETTPPPRGSLEVSPEARGKAEQALGALRAEAQATPLYALLDSARSERVLELLRESVETYRSLFEGLRGSLVEEAAPYLVELPADSRLLGRLVQEGWGKSWGVYLASRRPFAEVRRHFRKLLYVKEEDTRKEMFFRFYDPRVLRVFLPSCSARQTDEIYGEIEVFVMEGEEGEALRFPFPLARGI